LRKGNFIHHLINAAIFIVLEVAALNMLRNNSPLQDTWFAKGGHTVMGTIFGWNLDIKEYFTLRKRNDQLALENFELAARLAELEDFIADSTHQSLLPSDGIVNGYRYIPATIEKISNNSQHNYIILDKGSNSGVETGFGVITRNGAIGIIDAVSENYSYARSFKNHKMNLSSRLGKDGAVGTMRWDGMSRNKAVLREIPHHIQDFAGDTVYTSGYSAIFPAGIPLGTAGKGKIVNGSTYEIEVSLFEDFNSLRYAIIVGNVGNDEISQLEKQAQ
jgi:rod shape-determining protein MreC